MKPTLRDEIEKLMSEKEHREMTMGCFYQDELRENYAKVKKVIAQVEAKAVERAIQAVITELRNAIWQEKETIHGRVVEFSEERFLKAFKLARQALQKDTI